MLFNADEVSAGEIKHAIRFILPNAASGRRYVHPGTHSPLRRPAARRAAVWRAHAAAQDFPLETLPSEGARVVARALQDYGMFLADGGNIALTGASDRTTQAKWPDVGVDPIR